MENKMREEFEVKYGTGDRLVDSISLAIREDGEYEQALARLCFKWFSHGHRAGRNHPIEVSLEEAARALDISLKINNFKALNIDRMKVLAKAVLSLVPNCVVKE